MPTSWAKLDDVSFACLSSDSLSTSCVSATMALQRMPLGAREVQIIRRLKHVLQLPITQIAVATERKKTTIYDALKKSWRSSKRGPKEKLTRKDVNLLARTARSMIKKAAGKKEVTLAMIMRRARIKASARCVRKNLQKRNIRFRKMRSKPVLTKEDVRERFRFSKKYKAKSRAWWRNKMELRIDFKNFPVYPNAAARAYAAQREVRGAYRELRQGLDEGYVVVAKNLIYNTGARSARIAGGVGKGRVLLWHEVGRKWNGNVAAEFYAGLVRDALRRAYPRKRAYKVLEDNDPTGFKSSAGQKAKKAAKISVFVIPKRSPDLSVMDYAIWKEITRRMRVQERRFKTSRKETRAKFLSRLRRTAKSLPRAFVNKAIGNMKERCLRLYEAKGRHFEEGGTSYFAS